MHAGQCIAGPHGQIEICVENPGFSTCAIICHPHPLYGGSMTNKVVTTTAKALHTLGITTVRFNFRGVGKSEGQYDEGRGECQDLMHLLGWVKNTYSPDAIWLAGFSFGAYIAFQGSLSWPCQQLITLAPAISHCNFSHNSLPRCPWLLIQGDEDEVVDPKEVYRWVESLSTPPDLIRLPQAGHFFHGKLLELKEAIIHYFTHRQVHKLNRIDIIPPP